MKLPSFKNKLEEDGNSSRLQKVKDKEFKKYMSASWGKTEPVGIELVVPKQQAGIRRMNLSKKFPKDCLIIKAGTAPARCNDTNFRFRPNSDFAYLTGLGMDYEEEAVLVFIPHLVKLKNEKHQTHLATLYLNEPKGYSSDEFYTSAKSGEFWIGRRPDLKTFELTIGIRVKDLKELEADLKKIPKGSKTRVSSDDNFGSSDKELKTVLSEMRLIKDAYEISEIKKAVGFSIDAFKKVVAKLPEIIGKPRGEKLVEGIFNFEAMTKGNYVGFETIAASGNNATILHWIKNNAVLNDGELLLLDAGVEVDSLYTADITRTFPISGNFNFWQRQIYEAVLAATNEAIKVCRPGNKFKDVHSKAIAVLTEKLIDLKIIKVDFEEAMKNNLVRRWMCHGTSHHLGLDVHDCAKAKVEEYQGELKPGMVITVEPGLYFHENDELVVKEYRGIGIRIEDDILITENEPENLTENLPKNVEHLESWMKIVQEEGSKTLI